MFPGSGLYKPSLMETDVLWGKLIYFHFRPRRSYFSTLKWLGVEEVCEVVLRGRGRHWPLRCCKVAHLQCLRWCLGHPQQEQTHHRWIRARVALSQLTLLPSLLGHSQRLFLLGSLIASCWAASLMPPSFSNSVVELVANPNPAASFSGATPWLSVPHSPAQGWQIQLFSSWPPPSGSQWWEHTGCSWTRSCHRLVDFHWEDERLAEVNTIG